MMMLLNAYKMFVDYHTKNLLLTVSNLNDSIYTELYTKVICMVHTYYIEKGSISTGSECTQYSLCLLLFKL